MHKRSRQPAIATIALAAVILAACASPEPGSPAAVREAETQKEETKAKTAKQTVEELPDWFVKPPTDVDSVYSAGTATSPDIQLAVDKAVLNAKRTLADSINGVLSSKMKELIAEIGSNEDKEVVSEVERVTTNLITEVNVSGYTQADSKILPQGSQYRVYVLLRYPIGKANRILVDQVKKSRVLEAKLRASKAFAELEKDIQAARQKQN